VEVISYELKVIGEEETEESGLIGNHLRVAGILERANMV
jgi:hypothetical protein